MQYSDTFELHPNLSFHFVARCSLFEAKWRIRIDVRRWPCVSLNESLKVDSCRRTPALRLAARRSIEVGSIALHDNWLLAPLARPRKYMAAIELLHNFGQLDIDNNTFLSTRTVDTLSRQW